MGENRLCKHYDKAQIKAQIALVAAARAADFCHGGLRHLHGSSDGTGAEYLSPMDCARSTCGTGLQPEVSHELSRTICDGRPAVGAAVLSHRRAGGLSSDNFFDQLAGARKQANRAEERRVG